MAGLNRGKLKDLLRHWPRDTVAVHAWLETQGIYRQLADSYVDSGCILPVGSGAFVRAEHVLAQRSAACCEIGLGRQLLRNYHHRI